MKMTKLITPLLASVVLTAGLAGCQKTDPVAEKGPAEKAGAQIDKAAVKAGEQINKVAEKAGEQLQKAGGKMQEAAKDAQSNNAAKTDPTTAPVTDTTTTTTTTTTKP